MSDAYKCDRCGEYGDRPAIKVSSTAISDEFETDRGEDELCGECSREYVRFWHPDDPDP